MVCNAASHGGPEAHESVRNMDPDLFETTFRMNVKSPFLMTKTALPHLEKTKGSIVYISSLTGIFFVI
jgi:meso-butanediol dehydrogenase/(S,S)-butanediol dehydrogenase/diacetyl reductase